MNYPIGLIKSVEPLSMSHGPGMRFVIFIDDEDNLQISSIDLVTKILKYKHYFVSDGGVTLVCNNLNQKDFIISCLKLIKNCGLSVYMETKEFDSEIMSLVDKIIGEEDEN